MKRISSVIVLLSLLVFFSCSTPNQSTAGNNGDPSSPIAAIADTSFSGSTVASKNEAFMTSFAAAEVIGPAIMAMFTTMPSPSVRDLSGSGYSGTGIDAFNSTWKGTISASIDKTWTDSGSGASLTMKGSGQAVIDHNFTMYSNGDGSKHPGGDTYDSLGDVADGDTYFQDKNASVTANGNIALSTGKITKALALASGGTAHVTVEKAAYSLETDINASVTGLTVTCDPSSGQKKPKVTEGTANADLSVKMNLLFVVSSDNEAIKGGKLLLTANFTKSLSSLSASDLFSAVQNNPTAVYSALESYIGDMSGAKIDIRVYDNANTLVYTEAMTADDLAAMFHI